MIMLSAMESGKADVYLNEKDLNEKDHYFVTYVISTALSAPCRPTEAAPWRRMTKLLKDKTKFKREEMTGVPSPT